MIALIRKTRQPRYRWTWYVAAIAIYLLTLALPLDGLTSEAHRALAVFAVAVFLWGTNTLPLAVTAIVVLVMLPISGVLPHGETYKYFASEAVFFILGSFILASPVMRSGLSDRLAVWVVGRVGNRPARLLLAVMGLSFLMSWFVSEHAVVVMLFPLVLETVRSLGLQRGSEFGQAMFLALAWGAIIGGTATLLGGARGPLALGILQSTTGLSISFLGWTAAALPSALLLFGVGYALLVRLAAGEGQLDLEDTRRYLASRSVAMGRMSRREWLTAGIMLLTVSLWVFKGGALGLDVIAFGGVVLAFLLGVTNWREVEEDVNWGIFLMYGGAITLSAVLRDTGAAHAVVSMVLNGRHVSPAAIVLLLVLTAMGLTEAMSNAAAVAVLMPVGLALAVSYHLDPHVLTLGLALPTGMGFALPTATPALALILGSGYIGPTQLLRSGIWMKIAATVSFLMVSWFVWPLMGWEWVR